MNGRSPFASVKHRRGLQHGSSCQASGNQLETHIESQRLVTGLGVDPLFQKGQVACWFSGGVYINRLNIILCMIYMIDFRLNSLFSVDSYMDVFEFNSKCSRLLIDTKSYHDL